jgi:hypothetical protein
MSPRLAGTGFGTNEPLPNVELMIETVTVVGVRAGVGVGTGVGVGVVVGVGAVGVAEAVVDELPPQLVRASAATSTELRTMNDRISGSSYRRGTEAG